MCAHRGGGNHKWCCPQCWQACAINVRSIVARAMPRGRARARDVAQHHLQQGDGLRCVRKRVHVRVKHRYKCGPHRCAQIRAGLGARAALVGPEIAPHPAASSGTRPPGDSSGSHCSPTAGRAGVQGRHANNECKKGACRAAKKKSPIS